MEESEAGDNSSAGRDLRSTTCSSIAPDPPLATKVLENVSYSSILEFPPTQIPTWVEVMGRMLQMINKGHGQVPMEAAASMVAGEISSFYI